MRLTVLCLCIVTIVTGCGHKAEPVTIHRFEQFLFAAPGDKSHGSAADFDSPLLNYYPEDPEFMGAVADFCNDPVVRRTYEVTDSLYHNLSWLEQELGDALATARRLCPEVRYDRIYTLITADFGNYPNRVFCYGSDMAISIDCYALGHVEEMQMFGVPNYIMKLCSRKHIAADCMAAAARSHIVLPEGELTFLDHAIAEGKTLYFLDQVLPATPDTIKIRYTREQLEWMEANVAHVWGWLIQNNLPYSTDLAQLRNLMDDAPKTNAFGEGSAPRTGAYIGWQIVRKYMKKSGATMSELLADTDSRKILTQSGWRP